MAAPKVTVPDSIASHSPEQVAYFVRTAFCEATRTPWTLWTARRGLNYAADYRNVDGIVAPMKRRVYVADANQQKISEPVLVAIDIRDISFQR